MAKRPDEIVEQSGGIFRPRLSALEKAAKANLVGRNFKVGTRRTSARLEPTAWTALYDIARREGCSVDEIATEINFRKAASTSLTAALRVFILAYYQEAETEQGHKTAGHGSWERSKSERRIA